MHSSSHKPESTSTLHDCIIPDLISHHVQTNPNAEAICSSGGESMSYRALDHSSLVLANVLTAQGVGPEIIVPLCFEKSIWTVVAMVAVLRAGGAFVMLDPAHPTERLEVIISKCKATLAITSRASHQRMSQLLPHVICLDKHALAQLDREAGSQQQKQKRTPTPVLPTNIAYVVYTSGSTGTPKGAVIEHGSFCAGALGHARAMNMDPSTRAVQFASYNFDASITEMLTTLVVGGTVCVISETDRLDPTAFTAAVKTTRANFALLTASFITALPVDALTSLKTLVQGGEALPEAVQERWQDRVHLMNAYGQVEASVVSTCTSRITKESNGRSIGKAIAGRCWAVSPDDYHQLTPQGEIGELLVEGPHVGRGYLDEPEKTAAVFVDRPVWHSRLFPTESDPRALRFYRTGDLVVQEVDGNFTFAGRKDEQVKVNGQRIELGEIEHQFSLALPPSRDVIVELVKRKTRNGTHGMLMGFVAMGHDWNDDEAAAQQLLDAEMPEIEKKVGGVLPKFMIPATFVAVHEIPITLNGKVDRKVLRALGESRLTPGSKQQPGQQQQNVAPEEDSPAEKQIRQIWSKVLNIPETDIDRTSVFQSLGGDSISAMQVVSQAAARGMRVTVQRVLQQKTIQAIAADLTVAPEAAVAAQMTTAEETEEDVGEPFGLTPIQRLFFDLAPRGHNHDNISFLLRLNRELSPAALDKALDAVVKANPMLRARFFELNRGNWFQYISDKTDESYRVSSHTASDVQAEVLKIVSQSQRSLDIKNGPLVRANLINLQGGKGQLLFVCGHHLVTDFVSWRVILQQLEEHIQTGAITSMKSLSFQKWFSVQRNHIRSLPPQKLPFQLPAVDQAFWGMQETPNVYGDTVTEIVSLDEELSSAILSAASNSALEVEAVDVLLSAVMFAFHQTFPERSIPAFFVEGHGRESAWDETIDLASTVGWFTTILPMVLSEGDCKSPIEAVRRVKDLRAQFPDKGLAYFASRYYQRGQHPGDSSDDAMEITFNYAGMYQQLERRGGLFSEVSEYTLMNLDGFGETMPRFGLVEVLGNVEHGRIKLSFTINQRMRHQERIRTWMKKCRDVLADATAQLSSNSPSSNQLSSKPAQFPLLQASPSELTRLVDTVLPSIGVQASDVEDVYPCTPMQNGMLLSRVSERGSYISQIFLDVQSKQGPIDIARLEHAWQAVVDRHAALRTLFVESTRGDGTFDQVVLRQSHAAVLPVSGSVTFHTAPAWKAGQPEHHLFLEKDSASHVLLRLDISHASIDGSSTPTLIRDLKSAYDNASSLSGARPLYSTYVQQVSTTSYEDSLGYWKQHLAGVTPCHLPKWSDASTGVLKVEDVPAIRSQEVLSFCRQQGLTLSDLLKTAWAVVLRCYTGSESPVFGYLSSGRTDEHDDMLGVFSNIQPCAARLLPNQAVLDALKKMQDDGLEQMPHRDCPLAEVTHSIDTGDGSGEGLFNTAMSLQRISESDRASSLTVEITREMDPTEYAATFLGYVHGTEIQLGIEYWTSMISSAQAKNIAATVSKVLQSIVGNPNCAIGELDVLSERDTKSMKEWNAKLNGSAPVNSTIHQLIEQRSKEKPNRLAIRGWDGNLTYGKLDRLSSRLASHFYELGVRPETIVPVLMEKSAWTIVAMLAVLKAGGAFVPFDPEAPLDRLLRLREDTAAKFVVTSPTMANKLQGHIQQVVVSPDFIDGLPEKTFQESVKPDNLAYVLFTSGTTGTPKGIMMQHSQFLASSTNYCQVLDINKQSHVLQFSAYTFDASIFELWSTLSSGGCICQMSEEQRMNDVMGAINSFAADTIFMTPTMLSMMNPRDIPSIRTVITGGEVIPQDIFRIWAPALNLIEAYGPTETAVFATFQTGIDQNSDRFSIGQSFCCRTWIVDPEDTKLVPIGATGELWLEGPSLARGYLNNPTQTSKAFVTHQDFADPSSTRRFYRTGDLLRVKTDGSLQFVGRKDTQVKIRGQRVELSEVEHKALLVLESRMGLAAEVVDQKLVLLIEVQGLSSEEVASAIESLDTQLPSLLPRYMIPSTILPVAIPFPRSTSGKLDRKALRTMAKKMGLEQRAAKSDRRVVGNAQEQKAQQILSRVLNLPVDTVSLDDRFFHLGGDSFLAMKMVAAARAENLTLSVASVLRNPSVRDLAKEMSSLDPTAFKEEAVPFSLLGDRATAIQEEAIRACGDEIEDVYPVTPLQEAFFVESAKKPLAYTAAHIVEIPNDSNFDVEKFKAAWEVCVQQNPIMRTRLFQTLQTKPPRPMQAVMRRSTVEWETATDLQAYLRNAKTAPTTTLNRVAIVMDRATNGRYFVWLAHHSLYDGFSLGLALRSVYDILSGKTDSLKPVPFRTYIEHLQSVQESPAAKSFWKTYLASAPAPSFPPVKAMNADGTLHYRMRTQRRNQSGVTFATVLRAAWALLVGASSNGADDVVFGSIVHGRNAALDGIDAVMGPTISAIPVRVKFSRAERANAVLERVQDESSEMIQHEAIGMRNIQTLNADTARACSFGCLFVVQSAQQADVPWKVSSQEISLGSSASYPLTVVCSPLDDQTVNIEVTYATAAMQAAQVESLMSQFERVTQQLLSDDRKMTVADIDVKGIDLTAQKPAASRSITNAPVNTAPKSGKSDVLREIWAEALDLEDSTALGPQDDFIRLGGDSITAMQLSGIARREGFMLSVVDILGQSVFSDMESVMKAVNEDSAESVDPAAFSLMPEAVPVSECLQLAAADVGVDRDDIEDMYPCTPLQEGLMTSSSTQDGAYVARLVIDLNLDDLNRFKAAWESIVATHSNLRTRIVHLGAAGMFQVVLKSSKSVIDWRRSTDLNGYVSQDSQAPMSFGDALVRYGLVTAVDGVKFVWTAHHAVYDGATVALLSEAVNNIYTGKPAGKIPPFSRLMKYLTDADPAQTDVFWKENLAGARSMPFPLSISADNSVHVDSSVTQQVSLAGKPAGVTTAALLQTAWAYVLARYSGSNDVVLGLAQSGRLISVAEIERIPGPAITTIPLRICLESNQTVSSLLASVQKTSTESIPHSHRGLQNIRRVSEDAKQACEFRSLLTMYPKQEAQDLAFDMSKGRMLEGAEADFHTYPLLVECQFSESSAQFTATHDSKIIDPREMKWMMQQLEHVINQLTTDNSGSKLVRELEVLRPEDRSRIDQWGLTVGITEQVHHQAGWVVDQRDPEWLAPAGVVGELVVAEDGYPNKQTIRPRWLQNFEPKVQQVRLTGQLARFNCDGSLESFGDMRELVELDGRKFIPRDVEKLVSGLLWERDVKIRVAKDPENQEREVLTAFVALGNAYVNDQVARTILDALVPAAKDQLGRLLPSFMLPESFVPVQTLPDFADEQDDSVLSTEVVVVEKEHAVEPTRSMSIHAEPQTNAADMEARLVSLWEAVLGLDAVTARDSFLRLGGDSLDAMKFVAASRREGIVLTVKEIFDHPTISEMAKIARKLESTPVSPDTIAPFSILEGDAQEVVKEAAKACRIGREEVEDVYPCTPLQEGLMALSNIEQGAYIAEYVVPVPDIQKIMMAWKALVSTVPVLRTRIVQTDQWGCLQVVVKEAAEPTIVSGVPLNKYLEDGRKIAMRSGTPLVRASVVTDSSTNHLVLFVHHATFDGWAWNLILHRLHQLYEGQIVQPVAPYNRFIQYLQNELDLEDAENFWRSYLDNAERTAFPPTSSTTVPKPDSDCTRRIALRRGETASASTLGSLINTAWALLVSRYIDSQDVTLGVVLSGRTVPVDGIQDMIGPTFTTIPMRFSLDGGKTISELLKNARDVSISPAQHIGLQRIQQVSPSARAACEFSSLLVVQPAGKDEYDGPENFFLRNNQSHLISEFTNYGLILLCQILPNGNLDASMSFDSNIITEQQVNRLLGQFEHVLQQIFADEELPVAAVDFCSPEDQEEISGTIVNQNPGPRSSLCLHELVEGHAYANPNSLAVASWDGDLTYAQLDASATKLAGYLANTMGVRPGEMVPLCFEKSKWTQVAMLGVLKAGAAFLLMDPSNPITRLESICRRINATVAIVSANKANLLSGFVKKSFILDERINSLQSSPRLPVKISPNDAAYVVTTSGTSGEPKACIIEHGSIVAEALAFATMAHIDTDTRAMQFASYSFDASIIETIMVWAAGGCTCVLSETDRKENLPGAISKLKINWSLMTPSLAGILRPEDIPTMKTVVLGGEAATPELLSTWSGAVTLLQAYGPCECCPVACCSPAPMDSASNPRNIGQPLPGLHAWIVDPNAHDKLAPVGSVGELVIEGPTVGRGYVNDFVKTAAAFIRAPTWRQQIPGPLYRFYKTGDLVRYGEGGTIEFVGRKDSQIKINGQRLELAEIEHNLRRLMKKSSEIAVDLVESKDGKKILAAFVALGDGADEKKMEEALGDARLKLADLLPSYMVPRVYVPLPTLPLNSSGKVDRKSLSKMGPTVASNVAETKGSEPTTTTGKTLQSLWAKVLDVDANKIHTESSFLELGGDSLAAMRLSSKVREAGLSLSVADVLRRSRFADMEAACSSVVETPAIPEYKPFSSVSGIPNVNTFLEKSLGLDRSKVEDVMEATSTQTAMTLASMSRSQGTINHIWLDFNGAVDARRLRAACSKVVNHHGILRTVFVFYNESLMQVVLRSHEPDFSDRLVQGNVEDATNAFVQESKRGMQSIGKPGLKFCLLRHNINKTSRLVIQVPHNLYDGMSLPLILDHLRFAYEGFALPASPSFTAHLHAWRHIQETSGSKAFWQKSLAGSSMTDILLPGSQYANHFKQVNGHLSQRIPRAAFAFASATPTHAFETVLHASWALVLARLSGKTDIVFGRGVANRNLALPDIETVVGPTLNTVPVRIALAPTTKTAAFLADIEEARLAALPYECLETDSLVNECTAWPRGTRISSLLVHNNIAAAKTFAEGRLPDFAGLKCELGWMVRTWDAADVQITSTPEAGADGGMRIDLVFSEEVLPRETAERMLAMLCEGVGKLGGKGTVGELLGAARERHDEVCLPVVPRRCGSEYSFNSSEERSGMHSPAPSTPSSYEMI